MKEVLFGYGGIGIRHFVNQVHELIESRSDDDLRAPVGLTPFGGIIRGDGIVFAATTGGKSLRVNPEIILQYLNYRRGT